MNIKLCILIVPPASYKSLTPLRPMPSGSLSCSNSLQTTLPHSGQISDPGSQSIFYFPSHSGCLDSLDGESLLHIALIVLDFLISTFFSISAPLYNLSQPGTSPPLKSLTIHTHSLPKGIIILISFHKYPSLSSLRPQPLSSYSYIPHVTWELSLALCNGNQPMVAEPNRDLFSLS